jgi:hypothetical protein
MRLLNLGWLSGQGLAGRQQGFGSLPQVIR